MQLSSSGRAGDLNLCVTGSIPVAKPQSATLTRISPVKASIY